MTDSESVVITNDPSKAKPAIKSPVFHGRRMVSSTVNEVTRENVVEFLFDTMAQHLVNEREILYLRKYYRGIQPILRRDKKVRPEINNCIVENRANEIVTFKVGYLIGEPIQYVSRRGKNVGANGVEALNDMMLSEGKFAKDRDIVEDFTICGTAFRMVLPDKSFSNDDKDDICPFEIWTLEPERTYVAHSTDYTKRPLAGVTYSVDMNGRVTYDVYTSKKQFRVVDGNIELDKAHALGCVPIIEYPANRARIGAFEVVLPLLDALNVLQSNRVDGVEQFIQAVMAFENIDVTKSLLEALQEMCALQYESTPDKPASVKILSSELNQDQTQTLVDNLYDDVLSICGMPRRTGNGSTSDTGAAVIMRDGWQDAEARAKDSEWMFKSSEYEFLKLVLRILRDTNDIGLRFSDIDLKFTRRNYEAIQSKCQVLTTMLACEKIDPLLAFIHCGMFTDPEAAYRQSIEYVESQKKTLSEAAVQVAMEQGSTSGTPEPEGSYQQ